MTIPKKIYARFYDFHGRPAIEEAYPGGEATDEELDAAKAAARAAARAAAWAEEKWEMDRLRELLKK